MLPWLIDHLTPSERTPALPGYYVSRNTGKRPVVFLHGSAGDAHNFAPLLRWYSDHPSRTVVAPNYGHHGCAGSASSLAQLRPVVQRAVNASPDGTVDIVAHSAGGYFSLLVAAEFPVTTVVGLAACFRPFPLRPAWRAASRLAGYTIAEELTCEQKWAARDIRTLEIDRVVSIISDADQVVPAHSSSAPGCEMITLQGIRHQDMARLVKPVVLALEGSDAVRGIFRS